MNKQKIRAGARHKKDEKWSWGKRLCTVFLSTILTYEKNVVL
ncbi:hypothetical protein P4T20_02670 [Aneurinibacillus thermoaerophilus]|nr:hypothetical protein [Aneurinibacillus thermoaerophilus]